MRFRQKPCQAAGAAGHSDREFAWKMTEAWCCAGRKLIHAAIESELLAIRAGRNHPRWRPALSAQPPTGSGLVPLGTPTEQPLPLNSAGSGPTGCSRNPNG